MIKQKLFGWFNKIQYDLEKSSVVNVIIECNGALVENKMVSFLDASWVYYEKYKKIVTKKEGIINIFAKDIDRYRYCFGVKKYIKQEITIVSEIYLNENKKCERKLIMEVNVKPRTFHDGIKIYLADIFDSFARFLG